VVLTRLCGSDNIAAINSSRCHTADTLFADALTSAIFQTRASVLAVQERKAARLAAAAVTDAAAAAAAVATPDTVSEPARGVVAGGLTAPSQVLSHAGPDRAYDRTLVLLLGVVLGVLGVWFAASAVPALRMEWVVPVDAGAAAAVVVARKKKPAVSEGDVPLRDVGTGVLAASQ
jgi:hypothetical protein